MLFEKNKKFSSGNDIYDGVIIGKDVKLGKDNIILPGTVILGDVEIGNSNIIGPHATIGMPPQHIRYYRENTIANSKIKIGNKNILREFVTVHAPMSRDTKIGNDCFLMAYSHVSHDTHLGNNVVLTNCTEMGGYTTVLDYATIGLNTSIHQFTVIGQYSMVGMGSVVTKDIPPFLLYKNGKCDRVNEIGMLRNGFTGEHVKNVYNHYANGENLSEILEEVIPSFEKARNSETKRPLVKIELKKPKCYPI